MIKKLKVPSLLFSAITSKIDRVGILILVKFENLHDPFDSTNPLSCLKLLLVLPVLIAFNFLQRTGPEEWMCKSSKSC